MGQYTLYTYVSVLLLRSGASPTRSARYCWCSASSADRGLVRRRDSTATARSALVILASWRGDRGRRSGLSRAGAGDRRGRGLERRLRGGAVVYQTRRCAPGHVAGAGRGWINAPPTPASRRAAWAAFSRSAGSVKHWLPLLSSSRHRVVFLGRARSGGREEVNVCRIIGMRGRSEEGGTTLAPEIGVLALQGDVREHVRRSGRRGRDREAGPSPGRDRGGGRPGHPGRGIDHAVAPGDRVRAARPGLQADRRRAARLRLLRRADHAGRPARGRRRRASGRSAAST